ncbi:BQ2448_7923 [Microbotryum intermedium]|uniref:BQ2448_7923 protein n=1 Tax=Microbotryum intermedium TaxID=269621 RepID=A0A238FSR3_9BASI|nr:BQ2448_7923 [Microbotryum intermedium]
MVRLGTAAILASTVALVSAQYATPACLMPCYASSLTASGTTCGSTDIKCLCQDFKYQVATARCFKETCANLTETETASSIGLMSCASAGIIVNQAAISSALASSTGASSTAAAQTSKTATPAASTTEAATSAAAPSSAAPSAASAATSSAASVATSTASATSAVASVITSAAAAATSTRAASSADKVAVTGALGFVAGLVALFA